MATPWYEEAITALEDVLPLIPADSLLYTFVNRAINALIDDEIAFGMDLLREAESLVNEDTDSDVRDVIEATLHG